MAVQIQNEAQARAFVEQMAKIHEGAWSRDMDALWEIGEADCETIWCGYLWTEIESAVPEMDEDTNTLLADAIVDFYCDQMDIDED